MTSTGSDGLVLGWSILLTAFLGGDAGLERHLRKRPSFHVSCRRIDLKAPHSLANPQAQDARATRSFGHPSAHAGGVAAGVLSFPAVSEAFIAFAFSGSIVFGTTKRRMLPPMQTEMMTIGIRLATKPV